MLDPKMLLAILKRRKAVSPAQNEGFLPKADTDAEGSNFTTSPDTIQGQN